VVIFTFSGLKAAKAHSPQPLALGNELFYFNIAADY